MRRVASRRRLRLVIAGIVLVLAAWISIKPSGDRDWIPEHRSLPSVSFDRHLVTIDGVRDFQWRSLSDFDERRLTRTYDLDSVESLWYCISVFDPQGWRGPAHSLISFGFADGSFLALSVEARKEVGETYSVAKGLLKRFELTYVLGTERDLIGNRAALRPDQVYLYPIRAEPAALKALLSDVLRAAESLRERPEFYNTLTNNCTTRLRDHVNRVFPGRIPPSWRVLLPGYSDELLESLHLIDSELAVEQTRRRHDVKAAATGAMGTEDFSQRIRAALVEP